MTKKIKMFSYYPRPSYWQDEFNCMPSRARYVPTARTRSPPRSATSLPRSTRDLHASRTATSNPTVFKTYNPEARASFTSKEVVTLTGPAPRYIDGHAIYCLESVQDPHVRVVKGTKVQAFDAGKVVLEFQLPYGVSATDINVLFAENKLNIQVPHCLSATQECHIVDVVDGLLGDEYDEYGHYESLQAEINKEEQLERQKRQEEEERRRYRVLMERERRRAEEQAYTQYRPSKSDIFEPSGYFFPFSNQSNFSRLFFM